MIDQQNVASAKIETELRQEVRRLQELNGTLPDALNLMYEALMLLERLAAMNKADVAVAETKEELK